jgi:hypothetical protein
VSELRLLDSLSVNLPELLGELSYSGYHMLGFRTILLVEGATDLKVVQQFLRRMKKDHEIVLLPLGGSQLISSNAAPHLAEIMRITDSVSVLIDSEKDSEGGKLSEDRATFVQVCNELAIKCHVLERRAIENYFTDTAIKKVKGDKYRALEPFERLKDLTPAWSKVENWRIAREMTLSELKGTDLGQFIHTIR